MQLVKQGECLLLLPVTVPCIVHTLSIVLLLVLMCVSVHANIVRWTFEFDDTPLGGIEKVTKSEVPLTDTDEWRASNVGCYILILGKPLSCYIR